VKRETLGLSLLAATAVPNFLAGLLPSLMTIQRFGADELDRAALRRGQALGSSLALATGLGASLVSESPAPLVTTIVVLAILLAAYEHALRHPVAGARPIDEPA
jgi:hypothetical protein